MENDLFWERSSELRYNGASRQWEYLFEFGDHEYKVVQNFVICSHLGVTTEKSELGSRFIRTLSDKFKNFREVKKFRGFI